MRDGAGRRLTRRRFLVGMGSVLAVSAGVAGYGRYAEPYRVQVEEIGLRLPALPPQLAGLRLAQISDIHLGAYFTAERLEQAVERVNELRVDHLMLTGDFVSTHDHHQPTHAASRRAAAAALVEPLRRVEAPMTACIGNHDLWGGVDPILEMLRAARVTLLRNAALPLAGGLWLAGVDDVWSGRPDLRAALGEVPAGAVSLLLAHEPDYFDHVIAAEAPVAVQFSGHSHGGQVRLPRLWPGADGLYSYAPVLPRYAERYPIGLRRIGDRVVYTNRGLGCWPVPYRINCPPEITVFTLNRSEDG